MIKVLLFDFARTLLFPKNKMYLGGLNELHKKLSQVPGYKFLDNFELNQELLGYLYTIKNKYNLYILTAEHIQEVPEVKPQIEKVFKKVYVAKEMGFRKKDPNIYQVIAKELMVNPLEILFIDENEENISAANQADINTFQYTNNELLISKLESLNK